MGAGISLGCHTLAYAADKFRRQSWALRRHGVYDECLYQRVSSDDGCVYAIVVGWRDYGCLTQLVAMVGAMDRLAFERCRQERFQMSSWEPLTDGLDGSPDAAWVLCSWPWPTFDLPWRRAVRLARDYFETGWSDDGCA